MASLLIPKLPHKIKFISEQIQTDKEIEKKNFNNLNDDLSFNNFESRNNFDYSNIKGIINSKYYLLKKIGKGYSSKVYLCTTKEYVDARNINPIKYYSIKVIDPQKMNMEMFQNEAEILKSIEHENIVKYIDSGIGIKTKIKNGEKVVKDIFFIVLEYLEHEDILKYVSQISSNENVGFGEDYGRLILAQLLDGLEAMQTKNISHRDIKPDNIMIGGDDYKLKFVDFGFATNEWGPLTSFLGTPAYAAPELQYKIPYYGKSEDIFSLGVTLFILVTGQLPFKMALCNDTFYKYIFYSDYVGYWRNRKINVSPSFMELFDNLVAYDITQRPSISEIRQCSWMKEANFDLLPKLQEELKFRENIIKQRKNEKLIQNFKLKYEINNNKKEKKFSLLNTKRQVKKFGYLKDNIYHDISNSKNEQKLNLSKFNPNNSENNSEEFKKSSIIDIKEEKSKDLEKKDSQNDGGGTKNSEEKEGFIPIIIQSKTNNIAMTNIKLFLKAKGYNPIERDFGKVELTMSNGEVDVFLKIDTTKINNPILIYKKIKGLKDKYETFKKHIKLLKTRVL